MGRFAKHRPNVYAKKEEITIILAVVLLLPCPGDAVFHCESESTLFVLTKEDTTRNQWLSCIYNTVPEQFNPNIRVCAAHFTEDYFLNLGVACQLTLCTKAVSIKWGNSNFARTVWRFWLTACKYIFLFKEFATDNSNASFEQCRVVLVVCRFSDRKCRHGNFYAVWCNVTHKKSIWVIIISNYVPHWMQQMPRL